MNSKVEIVEAINALSGVPRDWVTDVTCFGVDTEGNVTDNLDEAVGLRVDIHSYRTHGPKDEQARDNEVAEVEAAIRALGLELAKDGDGDGDGKIYCYAVAPVA